MVTPVRRQYLDIKNAYPDALVLFRLGDFYEAFDDDARVASRELEITLTSRSMGKNLKIPMAGVPAHALESYLVRLIKKGYKVAICEQLSDPATSKGLLERDVVRVVTPGTVLETALLDQKANNYLVAVVQDGPQVGLAYVDASTGEFAATQTTPDKVHLELSRLDPAEILVPNPKESPEGTRLPLLPGTEDVYNFTELESAAFDYRLAQDTLLNHYGILSLESFGCADLPLAIRAAAGIIHYLGHTYKTAAPKLSPLSVYSISEFMVLDDQTRRNLELFRAGRQQSQRLSLLDTLDLTRTAMGGRLMRRWLGQPLLSLEDLNQRLDAVELFAQDAFLRSGIRAILAQIPDLERILARVQTGVVLPRELISLKTGLEGRDQLVQQLDASGFTEASGGGSSGASGDREEEPPPEGSKESVTLWLSNQLPTVSDLTQLIEAAVAPEPSASVGDGNVIREAFSAELDQLKRASGDARSFIADLESRERERTGIRGLKVGYNQVFGYYIEVSKANQEQVPQDYVRRQTLTNAERYVVPKLKEYESLVLNAREQIDQLERDLYRRLCAQIADYGPVLGRLAAAIARLDVFAAWAEVAVNNAYVRPSLDQGNQIRIKDGRHPVVERVLPVGSFVPNDVDLSNDDARLLVITGPNMAGKSTFIRQTALITLMAQVGSFVPAAEAHIGLVDRIFTRVGLQDDLSTGQSTFMVEMLETAAILNQATSRSLVILDEIGRGTSTYDGLSIARSVIEHLHNDPRLGCKTLFATHYHELTEVASLLPGVRNFSVAVTEEGGDVVFLHRIIAGGADRSYGVHVAQLAGLPPAVVSRAWEVLKELEMTGAAGQVSNYASGKASRQASGKGSRSIAAMQMALFQPEQPLMDEVLGLDIPNLTPLEAINKLYELQQRARDS